MCPCVQSGQTLSYVLLRWKDCPDYHCGASRLWCLIESVPWRKWRQKANHPQRTFFWGNSSPSWRIKMPRKERGGPRHPKGDLGRSAVRKTVCELTLLTGSANYVNSSRFLGHVTIFQVPGTWTFFYWDTISLVLDSLSKACKLILLLHPHSQSEMGHHTFWKTCVYPAILIISVCLVYSIIKEIGLDV